ncbi:membrane protein [Paenibacillus swuensis]|uniref:Membrane protein n=1 Tax=Paenibacillus swuensis TaxID=1178515 RepID=A0A172TLY3_9BACL|nr:hypothetical protein [Paenibacillus swuensis]ANE48065.1 membrane protein [Paenibacillus swuensis]
MKFSVRDSVKWSIFIAGVSFILACIFSVTSTTLLGGVSWGIGMCVVFMLILVGIFFDVMGLSAAAANETPFHAMASEKVHGARQAIGIVRNADRFSNFCNDVIGDICGVISGAAGALVVLKLLVSMNAENSVLTTVVSVVFAGIVSALTVGGKAMGKSFAIHYSTEIVLTIGKFFYLIEHHLGIRIFNAKKNKSSKNGKRGNKRAARSN